VSQDPNAAAGEFVDATPVPVIRHLNGKVAVLERRISFLRRKLDRPEYAASQSAEFDRAEVEALDDAIRALRFVERERSIEGHGS
jgi:hypothetical protein